MINLKIIAVLKMERYTMRSKIPKKCPPNNSFWFHICICALTKLRYFKEEINLKALSSSILFFAFRLKCE